MRTVLSNPFMLISSELNEPARPNHKYCVFILSFSLYALKWVDIGFLSVISLILGEKKVLDGDHVQSQR